MPRSSRKQHALPSLILLGLVSAACGGRTGLLEPFSSEAGGVDSGGDAGKAMGGGGSQAGTFSVGGRGGVPSVSGNTGVAGDGQAGEPATCTLPVADCAGARSSSGQTARTCGHVSSTATFS